MSLTLAMVPLLDGGLYGGLLLVVFGVLYGVITDVMATRLAG